MRINFNIARKFVFTGLLAVSIAGCNTTTMGVDSGSRASRSVAFTDNCARLRQPFIQIRAQRDKIIGRNVATGVAIGIVGALVAGADAEQAIAAGIVGGLVGAAAAYAENAQSRGATEASLARFANADARREATQNDRLVRTIVQMNACRLDQADGIIAQAKSKKITPEQAHVLLDRIKLETRSDNRAIARVAGFNKSYKAYVGVLDKRDVSAARATRTSVARYKPKVTRVNRTSTGRPAIAVVKATGATPVAAAENSRNLIRTAAVENVETVNAGIEARKKELDALIKRNAI